MIHISETFVKSERSRINLIITNTHVLVIPESPKTTDVTFRKVEVNGSAELPSASLKVVSGETADGQVEVKEADGSWTV